MNDANSLTSFLTKLILGLTLSPPLMKFHFICEITLQYVNGFSDIPFFTL